MDLQKNINEMLKIINDSTILELQEELENLKNGDINNQDENKYICSKCHTCLFYNDINMGDSTIKECKIQSKGIDLDELHHLKWISACDCDNLPRLNDIYNRECKYYSNKDKLYEFVKKEKERILKKSKSLNDYK